MERLVTPSHRHDRATRCRLLWGGAGAAVVLLTAAAGWLAWTAQRARSELMAAKAALPAVQSGVLSGNGSAGRELAAVRQHARTADHLTHDPVWAAASAVPFIGSPVVTTRGMTRAVRELTDVGLPPIVNAADTLRPAQLLSGGQLDVGAMQKAAPALSNAATTLATQRDLVARLEPSWLGPVSNAHSELLTELTSVTAASQAAAEASRLLPSMLGLNGTRRYFVGFQNPAELRATGGLLDAFAIVVADRGRLHIERVGANTQLPPLTHEVTDVDPAFAARYREWGGTSYWLEANASPNFPDVARVWEAMWEQGRGQRLDGAVALTPRALAAVLEATGPVTAHAVGQVDAQRIESLVTKDQYTMTQLGSHAQRKSLMLGVGSAAIDALFKGKASASTLLSGLLASAKEGDVLLHSRYADEEKQLIANGIAGALDDTTGPFAQAIVLNGAGGKLDTYLQSTLDYTVTSCSASGREVRLTVTLRNDAPTTGLPSYVTVRADQPPYPTKPSQNRSELEVLATKGAKLRKATLDGQPMARAAPDGEFADILSDDVSDVLIGEDELRGRPAYTLALELEAGKTRTLVLDLTEPASREALRLPRQVMVRPPVVHADLGTCGFGPTGQHEE
jgi:hypothetical protein